MYIWSDSASPDGSGALRLRCSIWWYVEMKAFHCYILQVIAMLLIIEPAGKYRIIFHIFWFKQRKEKLLLYVFFLLGDSPSSEFYVPTFRNTLSVPSS